MYNAYQLTMHHNVPRIRSLGLPLPAVIAIAAHRRTARSITALLHCMYVCNAIT
jgi:hypothetical protein